MKKIVTIILCSALVVISGCDNYDFAQEQFRKEVNCSVIRAWCTIAR